MGVLFFLSLPKVAETRIFEKVKMTGLGEENKPVGKGCIHNYNKSDNPFYRIKINPLEIIYKSKYRRKKLYLGLLADRTLLSTKKHKQ